MDWRLVQRAVERLQVLGATLPRTLLGWAAAAHRPAGALPPPAPRTWRQAGEIGVDELFVALNAVFRRVPSEEDLLHTVAESARIAEALEGTAAPDLYHDPEPLADPCVSEGWAFGSRFERLAYPSGCVLPPALEARAPWSREYPNAVAHAAILRHPGTPRPWVVCVHGAGQGRSTDLISFRVEHLYRRLGLNVALPVLPLHGRRAVRGLEVPGMDLVQNVAATIQAVHDIRRLVGWIRRQGAPHVAVYGVSLGGHTAGLVAGLEPSVGTVVAGVPVTGLARLLARQLRRVGGHRGRKLSGLLDCEEVLAVDRLVDPLSFAANPPRERRFIFAGLGDAVTTPDHALELWEHWERPSILWYPGGHVSHVWSGEVKAFLDAALGDLAPAA